MIILQGKRNSATVFAEKIDKETKKKISELLSDEAFSDSKVRIMPDAHSSKSAVVGTAMTLCGRVRPSLLGPDIGCGMEAVFLREKEADLEKLDKIIHEQIPCGKEIRENAIADFDFGALYCKDAVDTGRAARSLGTLGGGNHFIELDRCEDGTLVLIIHSGSRSLGSGVAEYYEHEAFRAMCKKERKKARSAYYEERGEGVPAKMNRKGKSPVKIVRENAVLEGKLFEMYLHDIAIVQEFAQKNRRLMAEIICREMGFSVESSFSCVHNFIEAEHMMLRKGAISARMGERVIVPLNMRDGAVIGTGLGNPEWNFSAPHGAGRACARHEAKKAFTVEEYRAQMAGIYTTTATEGSLDECPMAYKSPEKILPFLAETVEIEQIVKPIYNFKSCEQS
ncbi:MAG: RtcB family protein [Clostridia bacterium]|nr:RtcB family protein [Clostridia bacterium]